MRLDVKTINRNIIGKFYIRYFKKNYNNYMNLKKGRSPKEDFEKALIVLERVKNIMMKEYRERRAAVERILREKMQK